MATPPTGVSATASFVPDILEIIQEASERACVDNTSGGSLRSAKRSLDILSMEWANEGLNLWTLEFLVEPLLQGVFKYALPEDTVDVVVPMLRTVEGGKPRDIRMARFDFAGYANVLNKEDQGRPSQIFINRIVKPEFYVWMVPDNGNYSLAYWRLRRMKDASSATNDMDVPFRLIPALTAGLAYKLAQKSDSAKALARLPMLKADYDELFMKAKYEDHDRSDMFFTPLLDD